MYRSRIASQRIVRIVATALTLAAIAAGCGDGKPKFDTFPADTSVGAATTSPPPTTATAVATTTPAPSTIANPAETAAPPPPTTTLEESALEGFGGIRAALSNCAELPTACDPSSFALIDSPEYGRVKELIDGWVRDGVVVRTVAELDYDVIESVVLGVDQRSATVTACVVDGSWLMDSAGTPTDPSDDILIDDGLSSLRAVISIALTPEGWRSTNSTVTDKWSGEN
jgi:hypothetical protein